MNEVAKLLAEAQKMGIKIHLQDGQVKITLPWPLESTTDEARVVLGQLRRRQDEVIVALDPRQEEYWQNVLANTYHLLDPKRRPMRVLHGILKLLKVYGAYLGRDGNTLMLQQGVCPDTEWNECQAQIDTEQLEWLLKLSVMGYAREYVDLADECPKEWIDEILGKHGARIAELRAAIIEEMLEKNQRNGIYFEVGAGQKYCLVPCKTSRKLTEVTPEEYVLVSEAQEAGMLPPGPDGARSALKWVNQ